LTTYIDGVSRAILNVGKIYTLATQGRAAAQGVPTNILGTVGYGIDLIGNSNRPDGQIGPWQTWLGTANDAATMLADPFEGEMLAPGLLDDANSTLNNPAFGLTGLPATDIGNYFFGQHK
jgi:hypothetical protein